MRTRTVHPRVAELIEAGDLVLAPDVDPASVGYIEFATPTRPSHPVSGQLSIPACVLTVDVRRVIARHAGEAQLIAAMLEPITESAAAVAEVVYHHCGRRCAGCDQTFLGIYPTRAQQRAAAARTPSARRGRRAARRRLWRRLRTMLRQTQ